MAFDPNLASREIDDFNAEQGELVGDQMADIDLGFEEDAHLECAYEDRFAMYDDDPSPYDGMYSEC